MNKRGQAALEYMMTYGWAILVILIVGVFIWQSGIISQPNPPPGCRGFSQIVPLDTKLSVSGSTGTLLVVLSNDGGANMAIEHDSDIDATIYETDCSCSGTCTQDPFRPGQSISRNFTCNNFPYEVGDYYRAYINITYRNKASEITHTSSGVCWGTIE